MEILGNPNAETLMSIMASVGLAQNFSAVKSLVTTGIQQGHMKMHLLNILNSLEASETVSRKAILHFEKYSILQCCERVYCKRELKF